MPLLRRSGGSGLIEPQCDHPTSSGYDMRLPEGTIPERAHSSRRLRPGRAGHRHGGGRNFRLNPETRHSAGKEHETPMSIRRTQFATQARTWIILAGLAALFIGLGGLVGGRSGIILFAGIAIVFNLVMFWFSDRLALKASKAVPAEQSEAAGALPRHRGDRRPGGSPDAARLSDPVRPAERLCHGARPQEGGRRRHGGPASPSSPRPGARRARARDGAYRQPRHPRDDDRSDDRRRDRGDREHAPVLAALRRAATTRIRGRSG